MSKTKRPGSRTAAQRIVPLLAGAAVGVTSAVILSGTSATAAPETVTVTFTADGVTPDAVNLEPGDTVVFKNQVDPSSNGGLLSGLGGAVHNVSVEVTNAAQSPFELGPGESQPITYSEPVNTTYVGQYEAHTLLGLVNTDGMQTEGTVAVEAPEGDTPPVVELPDEPAPAPAPEQDNRNAQPPADEGQESNEPSGDSEPVDEPDVNYEEPGQNPAGEVVPEPGEQGPAPSGDDPATQPGGTAGQTPPDAGESIPAPENVEALPQQPEDDAAQIDRASNDSATSSLGLPAIMAVVLLSMVSAGLVRTLMVRRASV